MSSKGEYHLYHLTCLFFFFWYISRKQCLSLTQQNIHHLHYALTAAGSMGNTCVFTIIIYSNPSTNNMCSKCYKSILDRERRDQPQQVEQVEQRVSPLPTVTCTPEPTPVCTPDTSAQSDRKRCHVCSKKLGLTGLECKCGFIYCTTHRLPDTHCCTWDFKVCVVYMCMLCDRPRHVRSWRN